MSFNPSIDRRDLLSALTASLGVAMAVTSASAQPSSQLGTCSAVTGGSSHAQELAAAVKAVRDGVADEAVVASIAANRCPVCGCGLTDPFTGKPLQTRPAT
jgi:hypothetical protein